jgi:phosphate transport system protein
MLLRLSVEGAVDARNLGEHTVHRYDEELEALRAQVLRIGGLVEQQLEDALGALAEQDGERAERVVSGDEKVNELELKVDDECAKVLARRAPVAGDLRLVIGIIKTVNDLERIGDEAVRIARMALNMSARGGGNARTGDLRHLGPRVQSMLRGVLDAFARTDPEAAVRVMEADRDVDREYESLSREMITFMMEDSRLIPRGLDLQFAARALERIGDRACNIGEYVIYMVKGADVRHAPFAAKQSIVNRDD